MADVAVVRPTTAQQEPEWVVVLVVLLALLLGWLLKATVADSTILLASNGLAIQYPASWVRNSDPEEGLLWEAANLRSGSAYATRVNGRLLGADQLPMMEEGAELVAVANAWSFQQARLLDGYRTLAIDPVTLDGQPAVRIEAGFLAQPPAGALRQRLPVVVEMAEYIVPRGEGYYVITVAADAANMADEGAVLDDIVESIEWE